MSVWPCCVAVTTRWISLMYPHDGFEDPLEVWCTANCGDKFIAPKCHRVGPGMLFLFVCLEQKHSQLKLHTLQNFSLFIILAMKIYFLSLLGAFFHNAHDGDCMCECEVKRYSIFFLTKIVVYGPLRFFPFPFPLLIPLTSAFFRAYHLQ